MNLVFHIPEDGSEKREKTQLSLKFCVNRFWREFASVGMDFQAL